MVNAVTMRAANPQRTGVYIDTVLTKAAVKQHGLKATAWQVTGGDKRGTEGQLLLAPGVKMPDGSTRDLCLYVDMGNVACAFDAADPANVPKPLWSRQLGHPVTITKQQDEYGINLLAGAYSTGCLDVNAGILYAVIWTSPDGTAANGRHEFHAIYVDSGQPVHPPLSFEGVSYTVGNTTKRFVSAQRKQRAALLLSGGTVFVAFGSVSETSHTALGWLIAYEPSYQALSGAWCSAMSAKGFGAGIWNGGGGPAADGEGNIIVTTGNGSFDGELDFGESVVKLRYRPPTAQQIAEKQLSPMEVVGNFTPWTDDAMVDLDADGDDYGQAPDPKATNYRGYITAEGQGMGDLDLGSGAPLVNLKQQVVYAIGKHSVLYTVPLNMGRTTPADLQDAQANYRTSLATKPIFAGYNGLGLNAAPADPRDLPITYTGRTQHIHGEMVLWDTGTEQRLYLWAENNSLRCYRVNPDNSLTALGWSAEWASADCTGMGGMPGGMITLSWDGKDPETAVLWASIPYGDANQHVVQGRFLAYDPWDFGTYSDGHGHILPIFDSEKIQQTYLFNKFSRPVAAGHVFLPTYGSDISRWSLNI